MRKIGRVIHISPSKKALIKAERTPRIGENVIDENKKLVGKVFDMFGPTLSPYIAVEVKTKNPQTLINNNLYFSTRAYNKRSKKNK